MSGSYHLISRAGWNSCSLLYSTLVAHAPRIGQEGVWISHKQLSSSAEAPTESKFENLCPRSEEDLHIAL